MASVATYLFFPGTCEAAFEHYKTVFGTDYVGNGLMRMGDMPPMPDAPELSEERKQHVMHVALPILAGHMLMGSDDPDGTGMAGASIMLNPDTRDEADRLYAALSDGGSADQPMGEMFWGDYWGALTDKFGVSWQVDVAGEQHG